MMLKRNLGGDSRGVGAVEFALIAPVLITFIVGISQLGRLFFANADMKNAVAAGARFASTWQSPDGVPGDASIRALINQRLVRAGATSRATTTLTHGTDELGNPYLEIRMSYSVPLDFIFLDAPAVTLHETRRVFTQVAQANSTSYTAPTSSTSTTTGGTTTTTGGTTSTTTGGTTSTTTGGTSSTTTSSTSSAGTTTSTSSTSSAGATSSTSSTTSTSSTSSAGTTSASSTSASSTGGTSATSASSTSASTSSTSSTTSSSGNNASSGNNNASSGHAHGDCKKC